MTQQKSILVVVLTKFQRGSLKCLVDDDIVNGGHIDLSPYFSEPHRFSVCAQHCQNESIQMHGGGGGVFLCEVVVVGGEKINICQRSLVTQPVSLS